MIQKVVWQQMGGEVGLLITSLLQINRGIFQWKQFLKSVKIWQNYGHEFVASLFWPTLYVPQFPYRYGTEMAYYVLMCR